MDTTFQNSRNFIYPPGMANIINPSSQPFIPQYQIRPDILEPNKNTQSSFKVESIYNPYKLNPEIVIEHLDLDNFKASPCMLNYAHNHKHCPFFHNIKDRKRAGKFYISELCENCDNCSNGDNCLKSHNRVEQLYRPEKYKTKFCSFYPNNLDKCDYGIYCSFAHSEADIVVDLIHNYEYDKDFFMFIFKTVWCPFNLIVHDRALCVYAHNYQDFRRKPSLTFYQPLACPNWKTSEFICNYEDACPNHYNCDKSHGWKESEYHPLIYKTRVCPNLNKCGKSLDCPYYHTAQDQRVIGQQVHYKFFKYQPKNRTVTNTFKITNPVNSTGGNPMDKHLNNVDRTNSMTNIKFLNPKTIESDMTLPNFYKTPAAIHKFNSQNTINLNGMEESTYTDLYRGDNNLNDSGKFFNKNPGINFPKSAPFKSSVFTNKFQSPSRQLDPTKQSFCYQGYENRPNSFNKKNMTLSDKIENWNTSQKTMTTVREDDDKIAKKDSSNEDDLCVDILKRMVMAENEDQNKEKGLQSMNSPQSPSSERFENILKEICDEHN